MPETGSSPPAAAGQGIPAPGGTGDATAPGTPTAEYQPPALPPLRGAGLAHVVIPATAIWFLLFVVLLFFIPTLRANDQMIWLWTALAGWVLGLIGLSIYAWQRAAARRGTKGSSRGALEESFGPSSSPATDSGTDSDTSPDAASVTGPGTGRGTVPPTGSDARSDNGRAPFG